MWPNGPVCTNIYFILPQTITQTFVLVSHILNSFYIAYIFTYMNRPEHVPAEAMYVAATKEWTLGNTNESGYKIGIWKTWHETGYLRVTLDYSDTIPPFHYQRFHPDGTLSEEGDWYGGGKFGTVRHIRSEHPTPEPFRRDLSPQVWSFEVDFIDEQVYDTQRYFDKKGSLVSPSGHPAPAQRPASVATKAHYIKSDHSAANWAAGVFDCRVRNYVGEYTEWDNNGKLVRRVIHDKDGTDLERYYYTNGL